MTLPRVTMRHVRQVRRSGGKRICVDGIHTWCALHGFRVNEFDGAGVDGERMQATGDTFALKALAIAQAEQDGNHGR